MNTVIEPSYRQRLAYHAGLLGGICFLISVLLIIGNMETQQKIADHIEQEKRRTINQVLPPDLFDNEPLTNSKTLPEQRQLSSPITLYVATRKGEFNGVALQTSVYGWGSDIQFILAVDAHGKITGVRVISHKETPGLADKIEIEKSDWILGFNGKSLSNTSPAQWAVTKDGGEFDQFTGATITPRALVNGIHESLLILEENKQLLINAGKPEATSP